MTTETKTSTRTDAAIQREVVRVLKNEPAIGTANLAAVVHGGTVTLEGEVERECQSRAAIDAVRQVLGVQGVRDDVRVRERDVAAAVRGALRKAQIDAERIQVQQRSEGMIVLTGSVQNWRGSEEAARVAWSTPGVQNVENHLTLL